MFKERANEISIISLILLIIIIFFGVRPVIKNLHDTNLDMKVKEATLQRKQEKLDNLNTMKAQLTSIKESLILMQKALPKGKDIPGLLVSIGTIAGQSGLAVNSITPSTESTGVSTETAESSVTSLETTAIQSGIGSANFNLSLSGNYASFMAFLENLEKNIRPTSITSMRISAAKDKPMNINVNMVSYYQK